MNLATVNASNFSNADTAAAIYYIEEENLRRSKLETPLAPLPFGTAQEQKQSYELILTAILLAAHQGHLRIAAENNVTAKEIIQLLKTGTQTQAQLNASKAALTA